MRSVIFCFAALLLAAAPGIPLSLTPCPAWACRTRQPWVGSAGPTTTQPLSLGRYAGASTPYFQGSIDEVRIYDRALSEDEIRSLAQ